MGAGGIQFAIQITILQQEAEMLYPHFPSHKKRGEEDGTPELVFNKINNLMVLSQAFLSETVKRN